MFLHSLFLGTDLGDAGNVSGRGESALGQCSARLSSYTDVLRSAGLTKLFQRFLPIWKKIFIKVMFRLALQPPIPKHRQPKNIPLTSEVCQGEGSHQTFLRPL